MDTTKVEAAKTLAAEAQAARSGGVLAFLRRFGALFVEMVEGLAGLADEVQTIKSTVNALKGKDRK